MATNAQADEVPDCHESTIRVGRNLWSLHGMSHRILEALGIVQDKALSLAERGPQDYEEENDLERGIRIGRGMVPRSYKNGDDDEGIKRWHLVLAVLGVVIPIIGAAWSLSMQISAQSAMISGIRDHQRDQDERATRVEQQLQQLSRDRR